MATIRKAAVFKGFLGFKKILSKVLQRIGMLAGRMGFADVRKGMSPQMHQQMHLSGGNVQAGCSIWDGSIVNENLPFSSGRGRRVDGPTWQFPAKRAGYWGSVRGATPVFCGPQPCCCGADRQKPAGCGQKA